MTIKTTLINNYFYQYLPCLLLRDNLTFSFLVRDSPTNFNTAQTAIYVEFYIAFHNYAIILSRFQIRFLYQLLLNIFLLSRKFFFSCIPHNQRIILLHNYINYMLYLSFISVKITLFIFNLYIVKFTNE